MWKELRKNLPIKATLLPKKKREEVFVRRTSFKFYVRRDKYRMLLEADNALFLGRRKMWFLPRRLAICMINFENRICIYNKIVISWSSLAYSHNVK